MKISLLPATINIINLVFTNSANHIVMTKQKLIAKI